MKLKEWVFDLSVSENIPEIDNFLSTLKFDWFKQYEPEKLLRGLTKEE